jgi:hypothetical protein
MRANKEQAELALALLRKYCRAIPPDAFESLHSFIKATIPRLPRKATVEKHNHRWKKVAAP